MFGNVPVVPVVSAGLVGLVVAPAHFVALVYFVYFVLVEAARLSAAATVAVVIEAVVAVVDIHQAAGELMCLEMCRTLSINIGFARRDESRKINGEILTYTTYLLRAYAGREMGIIYLERCSILNDLVID